MVIAIPFDVFLFSIGSVRSFLFSVWGQHRGAEKAQDKKM